MRSVHVYTVNIYELLNAYKFSTTSMRTSRHDDTTHHYKTTGQGPP